jgi:uncharacterized protein (TIGR02246 family)
MTPKSSKETDETQIRNLIDTWAQAVRAKDSAGLVANVAPQVIMFDVINPLQYIGSDAMKTRAGQWLSSFQGPIGYEVHNLSITAGNDVAFCHSLNRVSGTNQEGMKIDMYWRATLCLRKLDGKWTVTHEHSSVPFDATTGKASLGLQP